MNHRVARALSAGLLVTAAAIRPAQSGRVPAPLPTCPPVGDTLSRLQPADSAYSPARRLAAVLGRGGLPVRCLTRSVMTGLAGVGNVAGVQTTQGTVTVFFVPPAERFRRAARWRASGYEYTYAKDGPHAARTTIRTNARRSSVFLRGVGEYFEIDDDSLALLVGRIVHAG